MIANKYRQQMRLDRFLTLYFFGPCKRLLRKRCGLEIPILMYHSIARDVDDGVHPYYRTVTTPETFDMHMEFLSQSGYEVLTLSEAVRLLKGESGIATQKNLSVSEMHKSSNSLRRLAVVTFDDGFRDFYTTAFPTLEKFGFKATVFLTSGLIGNIFITGRECLRATDIKELLEKGIEFGSHTVNHPQLKNLSRDEIIHELAGSKKMIEDITDSQVPLFSYPFGFPEEDRGFIKQLGTHLIEVGYLSGVTTVIGLSQIGDNLLFLKRLPVNDCDDRQLFQAKLKGEYNWMQMCQLIYKKLRTMHRSLTKS